MGIVQHLRQRIARHVVVVPVDTVRIRLILLRTPHLIHRPVALVERPHVQAVAASRVAAAAAADPVGHVPVLRRCTRPHSCVR